MQCIMMPSVLYCLTCLLRLFGAESEGFVVSFLLGSWALLHLRASAAAQSKGLFVAVREREKARMLGGLFLCK